MIKKQQQFLIKGMNQDIAETKVQPELAHSIKNLRVITDEDSGTLSLVTEKGTLIKTIDLSDTYIGKMNPTTISATCGVFYGGSYIYGWNSHYNVNVGTDLTLDYRTKVNVVNINFIFPENLPNTDLGYVDNDFPQYLVIPSDMDTEGWVYPEDAGNCSLHFDYDDWQFTIWKADGSISDDHISFKAGGPSTEIWNALYFNQLRKTSARTVSITIPAFEFRCAVNATADDLTTISDANIIYDEFVDILTQPFKRYKSWNFEKDINVCKIIGDCATDKFLILFGKTSLDEDCIVKIDNINTINPTLHILYSGNLNFNIQNPIKTYVSYENEKCIKVYWIDGLNQPRVINVADGIKYELCDTDLDNHFNFVTPIYCNETVTITKESFGGTFHSGTIQYFFTYIDQNEQESKIFYQSPLYYLTDNDKALSPEESSRNSFTINIKDVNLNNLLRSKLRIYSLQRTSLDAVPVARLVYELKLTEDTSDLTVTDTGNVGMNIDPQILLMLGCDEFIPKTVGVKDNTLFFGNIKTNAYGQSTKINEILGSDSFFETSVSVSSSSLHLKAIKKRNEGHSNTSEASTKEFQLNGTAINPNDSTCDFWNENGSDNDIKGFMYQEEYMLGVQLLHKSGEWSEPIWVCDKIMTQPPVAAPYHKVPYFYTTYSNDNDEINDLINHGYIAIRPLVVCNDYSSARVLCCGVLNPVLKYKDTLLSSWFFRPVKMNSIYTAEFNDPTLKGNAFSYINALGNDDDSISIVTEIQPVGGDSYLASTEVDSSKASDFKIMRTWRTFNSPEFEFEKINTISSNYNFCVCSDIPIHHVKYDIEMLTSTTTETLGNEFGFRKNSGTINYMSGTAKSSMTFVGGDRVWVDKVKNGNYIYTQVFPWHNNVSYSGHLDKDGHNKEADFIYGAPEKKTITNWRISQHPDGIKTTPIELNITDIAVVNENSTFIKGFNYLKDVDILVIGGTNDVGDVRIQYKSTPHAIIKFNYYNSNGFTSNTTYAALSYGYLKNKLYDSNVSTHFKGRFNGKPTDTSLYENTWYVAGNAVKLLKDEDVTVCWTKGDTYYQRYNCLKTYPFSHEAKNSIIDILSFMVQTRINIDGTYDKQKTDILHIEPQNFNKLNDVYSQMDNFFTYRKLDSDRFQNTFSNLVTWSKQKQFGESIDSWTNIHLTNVLDLDGSLGEITALKLWNNKLITFQQKGIALIKYNENAMVPQINGAPITLMNSGLVSGREYITNQFGCQNEWSIVNAKSGLYFSDDYNHKLYVLSDGIKCISDEFGFKSYLKNKNYSSVWTPNRNAWSEQNGGTLRTYYDQQLGDIYFTDGNSCLTYNENLNLFTSFYDYIDVGNKKLFDFVNIENKNYWILNNFTNNTPLFYEHRAIDNLNIFGNNKDYEIELTANIDPHVDKIFDTVEIRGDSNILSFTAVANPTGDPKAQNYYEINTESQYVKTSDTTVVSQKTYYTRNVDILQSGYNIVSNVNTTSLPFDTIKVNNEYQDTGTKELQFTKDMKTTASKNSMKQKFRIWRAQIGRDATNVRDRIRNYWSRIKLTKNGTSNLKAKIHDIVVDVYE